MQNGVCEAFNGRMRDELLNETLFYDLDHARAVIARRVAAYAANLAQRLWFPPDDRKRSQHRQQPYSGADSP